jgi:hypothetical protein
VLSLELREGVGDDGGDDLVFGLLGEFVGVLRGDMTLKHLVGFVDWFSFFLFGK